MTISAKRSTNHQWLWIHGFTLVEMLVSVAIFTLLLIVLCSLTGQISTAWLFTASKADQFREARDGFEAMTRRISQATLNTYMDYVSVSGGAITYRSALSETGAGMANFAPNYYARASELRFISGPGLTGTGPSVPPRPTDAVFFQAPLGFVSNQTNYAGLANLLNTWGYYIEFKSDAAFEPSFITSLHTYVPRYRFRLMELMEPSDTLSIYKYTSGNPGLLSTQAGGMNWFTDPLSSGSEAHVLAENVVALIIIPKLSPEDQATEAAIPYSDPAGDGMLAPAYSYDSTSVGQAANASYGGGVDSRNQLPPLLEITMVSVDEPSFKRLIGSSTSPPNLGMATLFTTVGTSTEDPTLPGYAQDLQTLEGNLTALRLQYRVFTTTVAIKAAKWSRDQTN